MERNEIKGLIKEIAGPNVEIKDAGKWVSTHCLFAQWRHERGSDRNMSFGILENQHGDSVFNCFACKARGTLHDMLVMLEEYTGENYEDLLDEVVASESLGGSIPEWGSRKSGRSKGKLGEPLDEELIDIYDPAEGHPYLLKRGIGDEAARLMDLRVDPDDKNVERILFPVYRGKDFYGFTGRAVDDSAALRIKDYFGLPKSHLLLGSQLVSSDDRYIILVEGLFDYAKLIEYGYPALAVMHSSLTEHQAKLLKLFSLPVYVMFDNDKAGRDGTLAVKKALYGHVPLMKVRYPNRMVYDKKAGVKRQVKDPGELYDEEVSHMVEDARLL